MTELKSGLVDHVCQGGNGIELDCKECIVQSELDWNNVLEFRQLIKDAIEKSLMRITVNELKAEGK